MKAVVMHEYGGPAVLRYEDVPTPSPGPGEVLLRVGAVSVNRTLDLKVRQDGNNRGATFPIVLGVDPTGEVVEVGPGVENVRVAITSAGAPSSHVVRASTAATAAGGAARTRA